MAVTFTREAISAALEEGRVVIRIGRDWFLAKHTGFGVKDMGNGRWFVRVTGGAHPRPNGHGFITNIEGGDDIPFRVLETPL